MQDDAYKGIARIDFEIMREIGIKRGDVIMIKGGKETVASADKAYPADVGERIIRIDGIIRKNARTGVGENVIVKKAEIKEAKKVVIAPAQRGIMIQGNLKPGLLGRAVVKGDVVVLGGVRRRRDLMSDDLENLFGGVEDIFGDAFGGMGLGGLQQIRFLITNTTPNTPCIITENTEVVFSNKPVEVSEETNLPEVTYEDIGGLSEEVKKVREMVELPLKHPEIFDRLGIEPPKGVLLHGPPGTGKTLLAKAVANESEANFILLNGPEVMSKFYGESEKKVRDIFDEAEKNAPSIIFIDEIDAIAPKREDAGGEVERRVVSQLLTMMDGLQSRGKVVVIGATNRPNSIDEALRRPGRFDREVELRAPDKKGRLQILKIHTRNMPLTKDVDLNALAEITHGFVGADISSLAKEAAMVVLRRVLPKIELKEGESIPEEVLKELKVYKKDFDDALKVVRPSAMREVLVETPNINWEDVGGLDNVKQELKEVVEWPLKYPDSFTRLGIRPPRGILLYGPPGTGKTLLAKAVAKESEANFIQVKGPSLLSMWVGKSEEGVRKIFERARQVSPCIIFFDEIDALAGKRGIEQGTKVTERVLNQILAEMDGIEDLSNVIVIGATNRPDMLDAALLRPGRFDRILLTPAPSKEGREEIFKIHTKKMPLALSKHEVEDLDRRFKNAKIENITSKMAADEPIKQSDLINKKKKEIDFKELSDRDKLMYYISEKTEGFVGADMEALIREAAMLALREDIGAKEVKMSNFEDALKKVRASVTKGDIEKYKRIEEDYLRSAKAALETPVSYLG
ncbi:MAG: CDC48 family AAA ATPase [Candidatus Nanoarchaeia archaeon]|nr:CDC48 family AAA ATPase [Candidatus Nanoarchaeia archaeon]